MMFTYSIERRLQLVSLHRYHSVTWSAIRSAGRTALLEHPFAQRSCRAASTLGVRSYPGSGASREIVHQQRCQLDKRPAAAVVICGRRRPSPRARPATRGRSPGAMFSRMNWRIRRRTTCDRLDPDARRSLLEGFFFLRIDQDRQARGPVFHAVASPAALIRLVL